MYKLVSRVSRFSTTIAVSSVIFITGAAVAVAVAMGPPHWAQKVKISGPTVAAQHAQLVGDPIGAGQLQTTAGTESEGYMQEQQADGAKQSVTSSVVASGQGEVSVKVNGQNIDLSSGKQVKKVISAPDGQASVEVNVSSGPGVSSNSSSSALDLQVNNSSTSSTGSD